MNVTMLAPLPPPAGGIASWTLRYREYCQKNSIPLEIVNVAVQGQRAASGVSKRNVAEELGRTRSILRELRKKLKTAQPDVVHINTSCSPMGILRDALCTKIASGKAPTVIHFHCNIEDKVHGRISASALKYMTKKADKIIVLNQFSKRYIEKKTKQDKTVFIPNFIDEKRINENHIIRPKIETVVIVGHVQKSKGLLEIIDAAKKQTNKRFYLVGEVCEDISKLDFPENVVLTGRVDAYGVNQYLDDADVFLFPSKTEGFSVAVLEAMARGVPIIASSVGANPEMLENQGGIVLKDCTGQTIADALEQMQDVQTRQAMSRWNYEKVRREYLEQTVMAQYFALYESICMKGGNK